MDLMRIEAPDFDLAMTLNSGQVFHWEKYGAGFCGTIGEHAVYVEKRGEVLQIKMERGALRRHGQHQILQNVPRPTTAATAGSRELAPPSAARVVAHYFASGEADLDSWSALSDRQLREQLCESPGVGMKVANCVMLFAYERIAAFPIDVWIERVLREKYFARRRKVTGQMLADFAANYFGAHGGYAQQYLFHHARMTGKRKSQRYSIDQFH